MLNEDELSKLVMDIQKTGSKELRNNLLYNLKKDAFEITAKICKRFPTNEEQSVALGALDEAIDRFNPTKNPSFLSYVNKVIESRLKDFFKQEKRRAEKEYLSFDHSNVMILRQSWEEYRSREFSEDLRDEFICLNQFIEKLGYTWREVMESRPTRKDCLNRLQKIALHIVQSNLGERFLIEYPPSRELRNLIGENQRFLKKHRPFLCVLVVVLLYDFPIMKSHISLIGKGGTTDEAP